MALSEDYYHVLEISRDADATEIKKSFRRLALTYHPDRNHTPEAETRFKLINEAYAILSDPEKRRRYDRYGQSETVIDPFQGGVSAHDLRNVFGDEIFNNLFASLFGARSTQTITPVPIESHLKITLAEALTGGEREITIRCQRRCDTCQGQGGSRICSRCQGRGQVNENQGFFILPRPCVDCQGSGRDPRSSCRSCFGKGLRLMNTTAKVSFPAGVEHGQKLSISKAGNITSRDGSAGDVIVEVEILDDEIFERQGKDLITAITLPFDVLALGGESTVPLLEGGEATLNIPQGFQSGQMLRLPKKGMIEQGSQTRGDLLVYIEVTVPKVLTATEHELLVAFRSARLTSSRPHEKELTSLDSTIHQNDHIATPQNSSVSLKHRLRRWMSREL